MKTFTRLMENQLEKNTPSDMEAGIRGVQKVFSTFCYMLGPRCPEAMIAVAGFQSTMRALSGVLSARAIHIFSAVSRGPYL